MKPRTVTAPSALLVALVAAIAGCGEPTSPPGSNLNGTWHSETDGVETYAVLTNTTLTLFDNRSPLCFGDVLLPILSREGSIYQLQAPDSSTFTIEVTLDEKDRLTLQFPTGRLVLERSDADTDALAMCMGSGGGTAACSELPALDPDGFVEDSLTLTDAESAEGFNYDLYGLELDAAASVRIDLTSDIGPYLYIYDSSRNLLAEDFGSGEGTNSRVTLDLNAGCYRVEVTSYYAGVEGEYTLVSETN